MDTSELDYRAAARADRPAAARRTRRVAAARLRARERLDAPPSLLRPAERAAGRRASSSSTTRGSSRLACASGGRVAATAEVLLLERRNGQGLWEALARPSRRLRPGMRLGRGSSCSSRWATAAGSCGSTASRTARRRCRPTSASRSTTPTATRRCTRTRPARPRRRRPASTSRRSCSAGFDVERVTLHVGLDTFRPVTGGTVEEHPTPRRALPRRAGRAGSASRRRPASSRSARRRCVSSRRSPAARPLDGSDGPLRHARVRVPARRRLVTNFHLPRTTLLALVMAFAGVEQTRELYRLAIAERYRFYSFGDAMLIL